LDSLRTEGKKEGWKSGRKEGRKGRRVEGRKVKVRQERNEGGLDRGGRKEKGTQKLGKGNGDQ
jgi:hypothetical protein